MRYILFSLLTLGASNFSPLHAQKAMPALLVYNREAKRSLPLRLTKLSIDVSVTGNLATTTMDLTYFNPDLRRLEGQFYFPLGKGQTVSRFALEVNGHLREGVVVEKNRGQQIFENTERRRIDPGLLEWTKGNNFKARIYPIPAEGYKRVVIAYEQELSELKKGFLYLLPLQFQQKVNEFSLHIVVYKQKIPPVLEQNDLANLQFKSWRESYIADLTEKDYLPNKQLGFVVPKQAMQQDVFVYHDNQRNKTYFYAHFLPKVKTPLRKLPHNICLLWDASGSGEQRNIKKELNLLDAYFKKIGNAQIKVVTFSNDIRESKSFKINKGQWQGLKKYLQSVNYDGGTQLGVLNLKQYTCDEFILVSDGLSNFGKDTITLGRTPVIAINSSPNADHAYLQFVAQSTGGMYLDMTAIDQKQAIQSLLHQPFFFMKARFDHRQLSEVYPSLPVEVQKDFSVAGQLFGRTGRVTLEFGDGKNVLLKKEVIIDAGKHEIPDVIVRRVWAEKKLAELNINRKRNEQAIIALAKEQGIVTPFTSLLVLDFLEDYLRYHIVPPEKEMQKEYFARLTETHQNKEQAEKEHLENVVKLFNERIDWWKKEFPKDKPPVENKEKHKTHSTPIESREVIRRANRAELAEQVAHNNVLGVLTSSPNSTSNSIINSQPIRMAEAGIISDLSGSENFAEMVEKLGASLQPNSSRQSSSPKQMHVQVSKWNPDTPYLKALEKTNQQEWEQTYLSFRKGYANNPAFYFDVANYFYDHNLQKLSLRVLSNLAELELENHELLRMLGYRLFDMKEYKLAEAVFRQVLTLRKEEPQSYRDLALTLAAEGKYQQAIDLLYHIVTTRWHHRFPEIELIALNEMNDLIVTCGQSLDLSKIDKRLLKNLPVDLRVVLTWDADNTDIDLWVIDPNGEKCYYKNRNTYIGGHLSRDFTQGYGPEEFLLHKAKPGTYSVKAHFYGNHRQVLSGHVTVRADIFTRYGTQQQTKKTLILRLENVKDLFDVGDITIQ